jgi:hypothetical protein
VSPSLTPAKNTKSTKKQNVTELKTTVKTEKSLVKPSLEKPKKKK